MEDKHVKEGTDRAFDLIKGEHNKLTLDYRVIRQFNFVEPLTVELSEISASGKEVNKQKITPQETHFNPWVFRFTQNLKIVHGKVDITVKVGNLTHYQESIDIGNQAAASSSHVVKQHVPRLVLALNSTPQGNPVFEDKSLNEKIIIILKWINDRLERGLDDTVWLGLEGGRGLSLDELGLTEEHKADEMWARKITEFLIGSPYVMAGTIHRLKESDIYKNISDRISAKKDVYYPVAVQCQQSCTLALLTRGVTFEGLLPHGGCNAGNSKGLNIYTKQGGKWREGSNLLQAADALGVDPPAGPGTVFEFFSTKKGANKGGAHIGFILRTHSGNWHGLQTFDTGGLNASGRNNGVDLMAIGGSNLGSGIFDDPWVTRIQGSGEPFSGMGVLPSDSKPVEGLDKWSPMAYVRLVLKDQASNEVLYSSPFLRTHNNNKCFSNACYAWSLRALPFGDEISAIWQLWAPRNNLAKQFMESDSDTLVSDILGKFVSPAMKKLTPKDKPLRDNFNGLACVIDIESGKDGKVLMKTIFANTPDGSGNRIDTLPWGVRTQNNAQGVAISLDDVPDYIRGEE